MRKSIVFICMASSILAGCGRMGRAARIDPVSISGHTPSSECKYIAPFANEEPIAIDLDCFQFPQSNNVSSKDNAQETVQQGSNLDELARKLDQEENKRKVKKEDSDKINENNNDNILNVDMKSPLLTVKKIKFIKEMEKNYTAYSLSNADMYYRNRLESILINHANVICEKEKGLIFANEAAVSTAFDFLSSGFSTASTIVGGDSAKSILSGLAGFSTAGKSHVSANIYKNQIVPAITNVIDSERQRLLSDIIAKRPLSLSKYPADEMILLVNSYHQACSFQNGLQVLLKASINKAGSDAIIRSMNLRFAVNQLEAKLAEVKRNNNKLSEVQQANIKNYEEKIGELNLQIAATAQSIQGQASTATEQAAPPPVVDQTNGSTVASDAAGGT